MWIYCNLATSSRLAYFKVKSHKTGSYSILTEDITNLKHENLFPEPHVSQIQGGLDSPEESYIMKLEIEKEHGFTLGVCRGNHSIIPHFLGRRPGFGTWILLRNSTDRGLLSNPHQLLHGRKCITSTCPIQLAEFISVQRLRRFCVKHLNVGCAWIAVPSVWRSSWQC